MDDGLPPPKATILRAHRDTLAVRFDAPDAGWIFLSVPALFGDDPVGCTYLRDPFVDFIRWLEAIAVGADSSLWQIEEEGSTRHLMFIGSRLHLTISPCQLIVSRTEDCLLETVACTIGRHVLVSAFYRAFRVMVDDPGYDAGQWEGPPDGVIAGDIEDDDEYERVHSANPYDGHYLRPLRSDVIEAFLALQDGDAGLFA